MKAVKAVRFSYKSTPETRELLETFRMMVNHAIHVCLEEKIRGRLNLRNRIYRVFQDRYGVLSCYPYSVAEVAWSIIRKHKRWHRRPCARRLIMKMDAANYSLNYAILSLPFGKGQRRLLVPLQYGDYQRSFLMDKTLKRGSVTITDSSVLIAFSKETEVITPSRRVGYDLNEKSIVGSDGTRHDLSEVARLHTLYGIRRRDFYKRHPYDRRLKQKFASSRREKERVRQELHRVSTRIVEKARANKEAIILERLKGIRYAHMKGNGEGKRQRRRIALWPFRQLQQQVEYKAAWAGVPLEYVSPSWTSKTCNLCGYVNRRLKLTEKNWLCPCGAMLDRELNAAINIERRGTIRCLGEARPGARDRDEAVKGNPEGRRRRVIPRAEVPKLPLHPTKR